MIKAGVIPIAVNVNVADCRCYEAGCKILQQVIQSKKKCNAAGGVLE